MILRSLTVPFCFVTGYNRHVSFDYAEQSTMTDYYLIVASGAFVYKNKEKLSSLLLDQKLVPEIVEFGLKHGCAVRIFCEDDFAYCKIPPGYNREIRRWDRDIYRRFDEPLNELPAPVVQIGYFEPEEIVNEFFDEAHQKFGNSCFKGSLLLGGTHRWVEFNHPDAKKHIAFPRLLKDLGYNLDEAMYCGDNYNDIELLQMVRTPVVVGDAPPGVKALAKYVTLPSYENGIAMFFKEFFPKNT
jgi:hydroxymethylpyrimidine pyrophosphatase-like HAD family hydrolase